jgi:hypothetical protein
MVIYIPANGRESQLNWLGKRSMDMLPYIRALIASISGVEGYYKG